jgi:hypothetical protein
MSASAPSLRASISVRRPWLLAGGLFVLCAAVAKLLIHLYANRHYGYFTDELYYLACARHLAWGYVDQPPLIAAVARLEMFLWGDSLSAIRFLPALAGVGEVILTGLLARELGGGRFAQGLAALSVLFAPGFLGMDNLLSMNAFEPLFWLGCAYLVIRIVRTGNEKLWLWFGLMSGLGLLNKHSMLIFGFGIVSGLIVTRERICFRSRWIWLGAVLAFLIFLPNLIWNIQNHFPFLELQANIRRDGRNIQLGPLALFSQEVLAMLPLTLPIWLGGLWFLFFTEKGKPFRILGWACVVTFTVILVLNPRVYYLWPAFPILFAGGSLLWESWLERPRLRWARFAYPALLILAGVALAPMLCRSCHPKFTYRMQLHCMSSLRQLRNGSLDRCRKSMRRSSDGKRWWQQLLRYIRACRPMCGPKQPSSHRTLDKPAQSISLGRSTAYRRPSADIRTTSCGDRATIPVRA